jgi:nitrate reductase delta subunit
MTLFQRFAEIMEYPTPMLPRQVDECIGLLSSLNGKGTTLLKEFRRFLEKTPLNRMEEIYTRTFDLESVCYPYVGYHLFGDGSHRGMFMAGLKEHYHSYDFSGERELPDHLAVMLRFVSSQNDGEREELISECMLPALKKMIAAFEGSDHPYQGVFEALLHVLIDGETG